MNTGVKNGQTKNKDKNQYAKPAMKSYDGFYLTKNIDDVCD